MSAVRVDERLPARILGEFASADALMAALVRLRDAGYRTLETYTLFNMPRTTDALGARRTWLLAIAFIGGLTGLIVAYWIQWFADTWDYPLNVGGRPIHPLPAYIPSTFEETVLIASLAAFFGLFALLRLPALCVLLAACSKVHGAVAPTFQRMLVQPRYLPYGASAFFLDGRAMRTPPAGTVPRERDLMHPLLTTGMANGAIATTMPIPVTADLLATGASRFSIYCAVCHGARGDGQSVVASNMVDCPPPSLLSPAVHALPPGFLYQVIDHGFGRMPSYALQLSVHKR